MPAWSPRFQGEETQPDYRWQHSTAVSRKRACRPSVFRSVRQRLFERHRRAFFLCRRPILIAQRCADHFLISLHFNPIRGPPRAARDFQYRLCRAEQDGAPFNLSLSRFLSRQPCHALRHTASIAQAAEHFQAFPELYFGEFKLLLMLGDIPQVMHETSLVSIIPCIGKLAI